MWNLNFDKLAPLAPHGLGLIAIETGTCRGNGTLGLAKKFSRVVTMELSATLHQSACIRFQEQGLRHIEAHQGNSADLLPQILPTLPVQEPVFFFLDAHWSGDSTVDWKSSEWQGYGLDTAHLGKSPFPTGPEQCPLLEELRAIVRHCQGPAYILVDDTKNIPADGPGLKNGTFPGEDWSHLSKASVLGILEARLLAFHELANPAQYFISLGQIAPR